ncbi:hypothetical protein QN365_23700, partial [Pseudomonas sp. RTI1]|uniref:hypothetical protein n=1 Tax=Pseudomonas sp. RTI1 TaxID=3048636 RepID=UPI002B22ADB0
GVAVDAQMLPGFPRWPFVALIVLGLAALLPFLRGSAFTARNIPGTRASGNLLAWLTRPVQTKRNRTFVAMLGLLFVASAIWWRVWWL